MLPSFVKLIADEQVQRTHEASLEILDKVGLQVNSPRAREVFKYHGCDVDPESLRVTIPPKVVEEFLEHIPPRFTFRARDPAYDRTIPDDAPLVITASSAPYIIDPATGETRLARSEDIGRIARLIDDLPGIDLFSVPVLADDAPSGRYGLARFYASLKHCAKPVRGSGSPGNDIHSILELAYALAGSEQAYRDHPFITHHCCPIISPLKMDEKSTELMMFLAQQGLPAHPTVVPNGGLTSPMTLAGTLAQGNAEFLALAALTQMVRSETPMVYSSLSTVADMRTGAYASGGIECGMLNMAHAQMARYYSVPSSGYIGLTNSKVVDAQAGYERALSCMGGLLAGMHALQFAGLIDALMAFDYGMAVIDSEISLMLKRVARGMEFSEENLAIDEIRAVGPAGTFIATAGTLAHMSDSAFLPDIADRDPRQTWSEAGGHDAHARALGKAREILENERDALFSPEAEARIRRALENGADRDLGDGGPVGGAGQPADG